MIAVEGWKLLVVCLCVAIVSLVLAHLYRVVRTLLQARSELDQLQAKALADLRSAPPRQVPQSGSIAGGEAFDARAFGRSPLDALPNVNEAIRHVLEAQQQTELRIVDVDPTQRKLRLLVTRARKMCEPKSCCNCKWWDHEGGQAAIAQTNQVFLRAAQHIPPNVMGRVVKYDDDGTELPPDPTKQYPAVLNTWELFGACLLQNVGHHATDTCDEFEAGDAA